MPIREIDGSFRITANMKGDAPVPTCTLDSLIERYGPFDIVKIDCESCEHESIPCSRKIKEIEKIMMKYHRWYEDLERKLAEYGFEVLFSRVLIVPKLYNRATSPRLVNPSQGYIYAFKAKVYGTV